MSKRKLNPFLIIKLSNDLKRFLNNHYKEFPTVKNMKSVILVIEDSFFMFHLEDCQCQRIYSLPTSGNYMEISSGNDIEKIADFYNISHRLDEIFIEQLAKKIISRKTINNYQELFAMIDSSFQTNITFNQLLRNFGDFLK